MSTHRSERERDHTDSLQGPAVVRQVNHPQGSALPRLPSCQGHCETSAGTPHSDVLSPLLKPSPALRGHLCPPCAPDLPGSSCSGGRALPVMDGPCSGAGLLLGMQVQWAECLRPASHITLAGLILPTALALGLHGHFLPELQEP